MQSPTGGSRYNIIWVKLKKGEEVKLSAPKEYHRRLRNAIVKRKNKDLGFKILMAEEHKRHVLSFRSEGSILTVKLNLTLVSTWI